MDTLRGMHDVLPIEMAKHRYVIDTALNVAKLYGCKEVATPILENAIIFLKPLGLSSDVVSKEMYRFSDKSGNDIVLRPEGTSPLCRMFIRNDSIGNKFFYSGPMFRYERPQKGRTRQFHQIGVEFMGCKPSIADAVLIDLSKNILKALNIEAKLYINSIGDIHTRHTYRDVIRTYLKKMRLSEESMIRLESNPMRILDSKDSLDIDAIKELPPITDYLDKDGKRIWDDLQELLEGASIPFFVDTKLVRGLDYYSHTVFEWKSDNLGAQNTVIGGGRYDGLIGMMGGQDTPAVGFAGGIERLALLLSKDDQQVGRYFVIPLTNDDVGYAMRCMGLLIDNHLSVEILDDMNLSKSLKKIAHLNNSVAIIIGPDERKESCVIIKNLNSRTQDSVKFDNILGYIYGS